MKARKKQYVVKYLRKDGTTNIIQLEGITAEKLGDRCRDFDPNYGYILTITREAGYIDDINVEAENDNNK